MALETKERKLLRSSVFIWASEEAGEEFAKPGSTKKNRGEQIEICSPRNNGRSQLF